MERRKQIQTIFAGWSGRGMSRPNWKTSRSLRLGSSIFSEGYVTAHLVGKHGDLTPKSLSGGEVFQKQVLDRHRLKPCGKPPPSALKALMLPTIAP
jgi:hypothetical protein